MNLGSKIKQLRQTRNWSQADLSEKIGVKQKQISSYERGHSHPTTEVLIKIAETFDVSLDFLALERNGGNVQGKIKDPELLKYFEIIDGFSDEQKAAAKQVLELICFKNSVSLLAGTK